MRANNKYNSITANQIEIKILCHYCQIKLANHYEYKNLNENS